MSVKFARMFFTASFLTCCLFFSPTGEAGVGVYKGPPNCSLFLNGEIDAASVSQVMDMPCEHVLVFLDSQGGGFHAAMDLGRWLRKLRAEAWILTDAECLSSCALVYIGATTRINGGVIGLHRPYLGGMPLPEETVKETVETMMKNLRDYVAEMNITQEFADIMQNTPPSDVRTFQGTEIQRLVPDRDFVDEELEIARNAEYYRLPAQEYRRRDHAAEAECLEEKFVSPKAYYECRTPIIFGISKAEFEARQSRIFDECYQEGLAMLPHSENPRHPATKAFNECSRDVMAGRR